MLSTTYRKRVVSLVIQLAKDDPHLVKAVITRLRGTGEIEKDDLVYLDRIADRWIDIAQKNRKQPVKQELKWPTLQTADEPLTPPPEAAPAVLRAA
jgi:hypothetical protein